jgi:hypothetical protein
VSISDSVSIMDVTHSCPSYPVPVEQDPLKLLTLARVVTLQRFASVFDLVQSTSVIENRSLLFLVPRKQLSAVVGGLSCLGLLLTYSHSCWVLGALLGRLTG